MRMKVDLLKEFIVKLNIMVENCEKIRNDDILMDKIDMREINNRSISIHDDACFFYDGYHNFFTMFWDDETLTLDDDLLESIFPRNEFDPIILCLEQPDLRKYDTEIIKKVIAFCDDISERIKIHSRTQKPVLLLECSQMAVQEGLSSNAKLCSK